jgi:hypothetical protein
VTPGFDGGNFGGRTANGRPIVGAAVPRPVLSATNVGFVYPVSYYYPWYGAGFGWSFGYAYNPWYYTGTPGWMWSRYGPWYDPFSYYPYDPYAPYDPYYSPYGYSSSSSEADYRPSRKPAVGSLRLKASPATAKVYVDVTLMGTVDDFDGLSHHLELELGTHRLEIRAEGYATMSKDVDVTEGTSTIRLDLKKTKK